MKKWSEIVPFPTRSRIALYEVLVQTDVGMGVLINEEGMTVFSTADLPIPCT